jgi:tetratricopeptide (TPR) repeat protein
VFATLVLATSVVPAAPPAPDLAAAERLYQQTDYRAALKLAESAPQRDAATAQLIGRCRFMLGDYKSATEALETSVRLEPNVAEHYLWLGRAWGRRAENNAFMAMHYASLCRENLERAVQLDSSNREATGDLLEYYLEAPAMLGGGVERAQKLSEVIQKFDQVEYHWARAHIEIHEKRYDQAESELNKTVEMAPQQVHRWVELARFLAGHGRIQESEAAFERAAHIDPHDKRLLYGRGATYVKGGRNLDVAKTLLEAYLASPLTPDDPSREEVRKLLVQTAARRQHRPGAGN